MDRLFPTKPLRTAQLIIVATLLTFFAACDYSTYGSSTTGGTTPTSGATATPGSSTGTNTPTAVACTSHCGVGLQNGTLYTEPAAGDAPEVQAINGAQKSVELEIYLLTETNVIHALENAANRGVNVQVMLEPHPVGSGSTTPQETIDALNAAGVHAQDTNTAFALTHAKFMLIDIKRSISHQATLRNRRWAAHLPMPTAIT